jgi:hypothetical protein
MATIIVSTDPRRSVGFRNAPTSRSWIVEIHPELGGMNCDAPKSAFRKGTSRVNEKTSSAAQIPQQSPIHALTLGGEE